MHKKDKPDFGALALRIIYVQNAFMSERTRRVEFLGHDEQGQAVFRDCEYPSDAPRTTDVRTETAAWKSPDVFRMSPEMARRRYGHDYMERGHEEPEPQWPQARDIFKDEWNRAATRPRNEALEKHGAAIEAEILKPRWPEKKQRTEPEHEQDTDIDR